MPKRVYSLDVKASILRERLAGVPSLKIAEKYGCSESLPYSLEAQYRTVENVLADRRVSQVYTSVKRKGRPGRLSDEMRLQLHADYAAGELVPDLAAKYGIDEDYVKNSVKAGGVVRGAILERAAPVKADEPRPKPRVDHLDLARRYAAGEFDRHELARRMRGEL